MRTGLAASTVTPGMTAPDVSFTVPVNTLCARAAAGIRTRLASTSKDVLATKRAICSPNQRPGPIHNTSAATRRGMALAKSTLTLFAVKRVRQLGSGDLRSDFLECNRRQRIDLARLGAA